MAPKRLATTARTGVRQVIASQIDRENGRSIGFRLCRLRAAVARSRSVAEAAASARDRCTMPPCRCLSRSLVVLAVELVHRWDTPLVNLAVACVGPLVQSARSTRTPKVQSAVTKRRKPIAVKPLLTPPRYDWTHPVCSWSRTATVRRSLLPREIRLLATLRRRRATRRRAEAGRSW